VALKRWGAGTVGAIVSDARGGTAVATSTGGCVPALRGRVGDTPILGCGFFVDGTGTVAATGIGEHIVRRRLAGAVHGWAASGVPLPEALERGVALFPADIDVGLIAVAGGGWAVASNRTMPWAEIVF
jgi:L-asparaginase/beta-aspartyl-peptidase (threonine type)